MARNYGARYIREQEKNYGARLSRKSTFWEPTRIPNNNAPPEGFQRAIMEWLDNDLPTIIKKNINFDKNASTQWVRLSTNLDTCDEVRHGRLVFYPEKVEVARQDRHWNETILVSVEYAHPEIFEILRAALTRFYNGV